MATVAYVTREQWGARPPRSVQHLDPADQLGAAIHYSAADADEAADHNNCAGRVRGIQTFHMDLRDPPFVDIAYNLLTCKHGAIFVGRGLGVRSAGQGTTEGNDAFHAVCFLGDDTANRDDVTDAGRIALRSAVELVRARFPAARLVRPHSSFHSTACPGNELRAWISAGLPVRSAVAMPDPASSLVGRVLEMASAMTDEDWTRLEDTLARAFHRGLNGALTRYGAPDSNRTILALQQGIERIGTALAEAPGELAAALNPPTAAELDQARRIEAARAAAAGPTDG